MIKAQKGLKVLGGIFLISLVLAIALGIQNPKEFWASYLFNLIFWMGLSLGCMGLLMINYLSGGRWAYFTRGFLTAGMKMIPLGMIWFVPLLFSLSQIYPWMDTALLKTIATSKAHYLNSSFFIIRTVIYFSAWILLWRFIGNYSKQNEVQAQPQILRKLREISAMGLVLYVLTMTFASIDWVMSIEPEWSSTMFPVIIIISQILKALCFSIICTSSYLDQMEGSAELKTKSLHQLGNLLLAFVILWTYISFSQFLIMWAGDLPHEIAWYIHRSTASWQWITSFLFIAHFILPFIFLLFIPIKKSSRNLGFIAGWVLFSKWIEDLWLILPSFSLHSSLTCATVTVSMATFWLAAILIQLQRTKFIQANDPRFTFINSESSYEEIGKSAAIKR
jgi:hypothetical protein